MGDPHISTCLAAYDFGSAFVSLSHDYLFAVLRAGNAPAGLLNVLAALYIGCFSYILGSDPLADLFRILCGVLQGCPLSGSV